MIPYESKAFFKNGAECGMDPAKAYKKFIRNEHIL